MEHQRRLDLRSTTLGKSMEFTFRESMLETTRYKAVNRLQASSKPAARWNGYRTVVAHGRFRDHPLAAGAGRGRIARIGGAVPASSTQDGWQVPDAQDAAAEVAIGTRQPSIRGHGRLASGRHPARPAEGRGWFIAGRCRCSDRHRPASPVPGWKP